MSHNVPDPRDQIFDVAHLKTNIGARTGRAAGTLLLMSGLRILLQVASISVLARLISPDEYGIFALAAPGVALGLALSNFGLSQAIILRPQMTHRLASSLFWVSTIFGILATLAIAALAGIAAGFFNEPRVAPVFQVSAFAVLLSAMVGPYVAIMRRRLQVRGVEVISLGSEAVGLVLAIIAALLGASYWALVVQQLTGPFLTLIALIIWTGWRPSWPDPSQRDGVLPALQFGGYVVGYSIVARMTGYVGTIIAGRMFDDVTTGLFYRAHGLAEMPRQRVIRPLGTAFTPAMSRLHDDAEGLRALYRRTTSRSTLLMLPIALLLAIGADPLTAILMGPNWVAIVPVLSWLSLITAMAPLLFNLNNVLISQGQGRVLFVVTLMRLICVAVAMGLASSYGLQAMVMTYMLVELCVVLPLTIGVTIRYSPVTFRDVAQSGLLELGIAAAAGAVLWQIAPLWQGTHPLVQLVALGGAISCVYVLRILLDAGMRHDVRQMVLRRRPR